MVLLQLVKNWDNEFTKWLDNRVRCLPIDSGSKDEIDAKLRTLLVKHADIPCSHT